jgi:hypothetical protein
MASTFVIFIASSVYFLLKLKVCREVRHLERLEVYHREHREVHRVRRLPEEVVEVGVISDVFQAACR